MTNWSPEELDLIGNAEELVIASERPDGTLSSPRIIWVVRVGDELFVRSAHGNRAVWHQSVKRAMRGHISAGGVEKDVIFEDAAGQFNAELDAAYWDKYRGPLAEYVPPVADEESHATTIRLVPRA